MKTLIQRSCYALLGLSLLFALPPRSDAQEPATKSVASANSATGESKDGPSGGKASATPGNSSPATGGASNSNSSDPTGLAALFSLIAALSAATQRLVEIVKGWIPIINKPADVAPLVAGATDAQKTQYATDKANYDAAIDTYDRRVHVLAAVCGIITAGTAWPVVRALNFVQSLPHISDQGYGVPIKWWVITVIGLLSSSTSGPWNSISDWLKSLKKP